MGESRMFKVGNELTDFPRRIQYYDTTNATVKQRPRNLRLTA